MIDSQEQRITGKNHDTQVMLSIGMFAKARAVVKRDNVWIIDLDN